MTTDSKKASGSIAHLTVRKKAPATAAVLGYGELLAECGSNKNDRAIVLITACIGDGVNTEKAIIGTGYRCGLNPGHVAHILKQGTGINPEAHRWRRDEEGRYSLLS